MTVGFGGDVNVDVDVDVLLLGDCRVVVVLMNGTQGFQGEFEDEIVSNDKNELSAQGLTNKGDKEGIVRIKGNSQWICVY